MVSEPVQLALMKDLIEICSSISSSSNGSGGDKTSSDDNGDTTASTSNMGSGSTTIYTRNQIQVALIEISHLTYALGEASSSTLDDLIPALYKCLSDSDHGVRLEAAIAFQAVTVVFPNAGRKVIMVAIDNIRQNRNEVVALGIAPKQDLPDAIDPKTEIE